MAFCFFRSCSSRFCLTVASTLLRFPSRFPVFPILFHPVSRVSFPGSQYLAFCWFPFAPPRFAPAAAFLVLTLCFRFRSWSLLFPLSFVRFFPGSGYSGFALSFPFFPVFHRIWSFRCLFIHLPFRLFPCFPSGFGTQPYCASFHRFAVSPHSCYTASDLVLSLSAVPLSNHLRFWLLGWVMHPEN